MKEVKLPSGQYLLVEVPEESNQFRFQPSRYSDTGKLFYRPKNYTTPIQEKRLPPGQWAIIGKGDELTEEQWKEVVDTDGWKDDGYIDYGNQWSQTHVLSATESGKSLLTHHGYELNKTIILRKD